MSIGNTIRASRQARSLTHCALAPKVGITHTYLAQIEAGEKVFKGLLKAAGLPDMRIHDLRHTCATLLLVQGVHPKLVQETLGHSQIALTLDTYSHMIPVMKEEVASKMDAVLAS